MNLTKAEVITLAKMADAFVEDGSYLLEEGGECDLMRRVLKENSKLEHECPWLTFFLANGEPPRAKRMTVKILRERNKKAKTMRVSNKVTGAKKKKPKKAAKKSTKKGLRKPPQKICPECKLQVHARKLKCDCGHAWKRKA